MYIRKASQLAVLFLATTCTIAATHEDVGSPPCPGLPYGVEMGGVCPPRIASFCVLDGKACPVWNAERLLARVRVTHGDAKLCRQFLREEPEHVAFDTEHRLSPEEAGAFLFGAQNGFAGTLDIGQRAAHFDTNNDGILEYIVPARVPGGRNCDTMSFIPVNETLTAALDGPLASALTVAQMPGYSAGAA